MAAEAPKNQAAVYKTKHGFTIRTARGARAAPHPQNQLGEKTSFLLTAGFHEKRRSEWRQCSTLFCIKPAFIEQITSKYCIKN
jgi:hypothetical protein